jgi:hypothetical protein
MAKENKKTYGCCLLELIIVATIIIFGKELSKAISNINAEYFVDETNCIHSNDNCSHIQFAKERDYTISKIKKSEAIKKQVNICKECYPVQEQEEYNAKLKERISDDQYMKDWEAWIYLNKYTESPRYKDLYVYMESNGKMHINGKCFEAKNIKLQRVRFDDVRHIEATCDCVSRRFVDFIYKKVNDGIYDVSTIDIIDEEE